MQYLDDALDQYSNSDMYPFHMPGHKRTGLPFTNPYSIDITEVEGFDNLHHAKGIIKEAQLRAADLYQSKHCFYLVNGSTCGLLAVICAATRKRDKVLVARNCHKAVYHALFLNELTAEYLYPAITGNDLQGQITPEQVEAALYHNPDTAAVIITSPTYEGIVSDVGGIAEVCHTYGVPLIVDEAHGAHMGFGAGFPENAVKLGADAVVMSLHKTLPSFTQTALMHLGTDRIVADEVERYLGIFETSSPSYILMAGMDACIRLISEKGNKLFSQYRELLNDFYRSTADLKRLHVMKAEDFTREEAYDWDDSKLVVFSENAGLTGEELGRILMERYHLQMELVSGSYVLGMTSILDKKEGFDRLSKALHEIDDNMRKAAMAAGCPHTEESISYGRETKNTGFIKRMYQKNQREMQIYQAAELPYIEKSFEEAVGKMSAETIYLYPPGIPLIVPGEIINREFIEKMRECTRKGLCLEGSVNLSSERIKIVYF